MMYIQFFDDENTCIGMIQISAWNSHKHNDDLSFDFTDSFNVKHTLLPSGFTNEPCPEQIYWDSIQIVGENGEEMFEFDKEDIFPEESN